MGFVPPGAVPNALDVPAPPNEKPPLSGWVCCELPPNPPPPVVPKALLAVPNPVLGAVLNRPPLDCAVLVFAVPNRPVAAGFVPPNMLPPPPKPEPVVWVVPNGEAVLVGWVLKRPPPVLPPGAPNDPEGFCCPNPPKLVLVPKAPG